MSRAVVIRYMTSILAAATLFGIVAPPIQDKKPEPPVVTVTATAEVMAEPDEARVSLGVMAQAPTAKEAQEKANVVATRFLAEAAKLGIAKKDLQTSRLSLNPVWSNRPNQPQKIESYQATNTLSATLTNFALIGRVIDAGVASGVNNVEGVYFSLRNKEPQMKALGDAVKEAARKAQVIAAALDMQLAGVVEVSEGGSMPMPMFKGGDRMELAATTPIEPGQLSVTATVTVRYALKAR